LFFIVGLFLVQEISLSAAAAMIDFTVVAREFKSADKIIAPEFVGQRHLFR
jgi:hypothetical protein